MKYLFTLFLCLASVFHVNAQSLSLFDIDRSHFPTIKARFYAFDAAGKQVRPSASELTLTENGQPRVLSSVTCPPAAQPIAISSVLTVDVSGSMSGGSGATPNIDIAKAAANAWIQALPAGLSECALTSFDQSGYVNIDFTTNRTRLLTALSTLAPSGGTNYNAGLLQQFTGTLQISPRGKYKRVVVFLADGLPDSEPNTAAIIAEAKKLGCTIFTITLGMKCPTSLKNIASQTGGQWFENVTTTSEAVDIYRRTMHMLIGNDPCEITWTSDGSCEAGNSTVQVQWQTQAASSSYTRPPSAIASLNISPTFVVFGKQLPSTQHDTTITLTAQNADFTVSGINRTFGSSDFTAVNTSFPLFIPKNTSKVITLRFAPSDSALQYASFEIITDKCSGYFSASGGYPGKKMTTSTLKLTKPNGAEEFVVGSDTTIEWNGVAPSDMVKLEYTIDNGKTWVPITVSASKLQYVWKSIPKPPSNLCKVRVKQVGGAGIAGTEQFNLGGHTRGVNTVQWSPDGTKVATASEDHTAIIWSATSGVRLFTLRGPKYVRDIKWSPDGSKLAMACFDKTAIIWSATNGTKLFTLSGHTGGVSSVEWSPDGLKVVTRSEDYDIMTKSKDYSAIIWSATNGTKLFTLGGHTKYVTSVKWSPDGSKVVTASNDNTAIIWSATSGIKLFTLSGHTDEVKAAEWSPDGDRIATASYDWTAIIWSATSGAKLVTLRTQNRIVNAIQWSPDGANVATVGYDTTAIIWSATSGTKLFSLSVPTSRITAAQWSPDGSKIATVRLDNDTVNTSENYTAIIWSATNGTKLFTLNAHSDNIYDIQWSPNGAHVATTSEDNTVIIWSVANGTKLFTLGGHTDYVTAVQWSPDGSKVVTASWDETAIIWSATQGIQLFTLRHTNVVSAAQWSPDGSKVVTASWDKTAIIWSATSGAKLITLGGHTQGVNAVQWSPDGSKVVTASNDETAIIWSATSGTKLFTLKGHNDFVTHVKWSPDGTKVVTVPRNNTAIIWSATSGTKLFTLSGHTDWVNDIQWSPDGSKVATASTDNTAIIWSATSGTKLFTLLGHTQPLIAIQWSPDGSKVATASYDNTANIWSATNGTKLFTLSAHTSYVSGIKWSPDGSKIVTASYDNTAIIWSATSGTKLFTLSGHIDRVGPPVEWSPDGSKVATASDDKTVRIWYVENNFLQEDSSDAAFSIVAPTPTSQDVDMMKCLVGSGRDSVVTTFIQNTGTYPLRIDSIFITGADSSQFSLVSGIPPFSVPPGSEKQVEFHFGPTSIGVKTAQIVIYTQADTLRQAIRGEGFASSLKIVNEEIDFGKVLVGNPKDTLHFVTLKNFGATPITITSTRQAGPNTVDFSILSGNGAFTLAAGDTAKIDLRFLPKYEGRTNGRLLFDYNGIGSPATIQLFGEGVIKTIGVTEDGGNRLFIPANTSTSLSTRPNPAQDNLQIQYGLREPLTVTLELLTMTGQVAQTILSNQTQAAGQYTLTSDLRVLGNGVYLLRLRTNKEMLTTRVDVVK